MSKVFLGGTCNESTWRDKLIPLLENNDIEYFNPVVDDWNEECFQEELRQKELCDIKLFVITPLMTGTYSIAEAVDFSNKEPNNTIFVIARDDRDKDGKLVTFNQGQLNSLFRVGEIIQDNGANFHSFTNISDITLESVVSVIKSIR